MKLYYHPISTTSRPVMLFAADNGLDLEFKLVDLFSGEHQQAPYAEINPNRQVPLLEDGHFRLTESSAILKYLAEKTHSSSYSRDVQQRARINAVMDWFNTGLYRDLGYCFIYPQWLPEYRRTDEKEQSNLLAWGRERGKNWLKILDQDLIGPARSYVCGEQISIADYLGAGMITLGEMIHLDYAAYPNVRRWLATLKAGPNWQTVHGTFNAMVDSMKPMRFEAL